MASVRLTAAALAVLFGASSCTSATPSGSRDADASTDNRPGHAMNSIPDERASEKGRTSGDPPPSAGGDTSAGGRMTGHAPQASTGIGPWNPGTYRYQIIRIYRSSMPGNPTFQKEDGIETWKIGRVNDEGRQQITISSKETPTFEDGTQVPDGYIIQWGPEGGTLFRWTGLKACRYEPAVLAVPSGKQDGFAWEASTRCNDESIDLEGELRINGTTRSVIRAWTNTSPGWPAFEKTDRMDFDLPNMPPKLYIPDGSEEVAGTNPRRRID